MGEGLRRGCLWLAVPLGLALSSGCGGDDGGIRLVPSPRLGPEAASGILFVDEGSGWTATLFDAANDLSTSFAPPADPRLFVVPRSESIDVLKRRWEVDQDRLMLRSDPISPPQVLFPDDEALAFALGEDSDWSMGPIPDELAGLRPTFRVDARCGPDLEPILRIDISPDEVTVLDEQTVFLRGDDPRTESSRYEGFVVRKDGTFHDPAWLTPTVEAVTLDGDGRLWVAQGRQVFRDDGTQVHDFGVGNRVFSLETGRDGRPLILVGPEATLSRPLVTRTVHRLENDVWRWIADIEPMFDIRKSDTLKPATRILPLGGALVAILGSSRNRAVSPRVYLAGDELVPFPFEGQAPPALDLSVIDFDPMSGRHVAGDIPGDLWIEVAPNANVLAPAERFPDEGWWTESILGSPLGLLVLHTSGNLRIHPGSRECPLARTGNVILHGELHAWGDDMLVVGVDANDEFTDFMILRGVLR